MADKQIKCGNCGKMFTITSGEQEFYQQRGMSEPKRCKECREGRKTNRDGGGGSKDSSGRVERAEREMDALFKPTKK